MDGRLRLEAGRCVVSLSTICRAVARGDLDLPGAEPVRRRLRRRGRRPRSGCGEARGRIRVQRELAERPEEARARSRLGDWEADTVVGVFRQPLVSQRDCGGNPGPKPSYAARPKSLRYCMGLL